jgi:hypothetical protein
MKFKKRSGMEKTVLLLLMHILIRKRNGKSIYIKKKEDNTFRASASFSDSSTYSPCISSSRPKNLSERISHKE